MRTYYIVEHCFVNKQDEKQWRVHHRGILSALGIFEIGNEVENARRSYISASHCERLLREYLNSMKTETKIVRVVRI